MYEISPYHPKKDKDNWELGEFVVPLPTANAITAYNMEVTGKIIVMSDERSGVSARNGAEWRARSYVLETSEQYPKKICFDVFGSDRLQAFNIKQGEVLTVKFDIDAHEYNGRWYNSVRAYQVDRTATSATAPVGMAVPPVAQGSPQPSPLVIEEEDSDLPF